MADVKTNKMLVNVILDRSGSMGSTREQTISGYNEYLNGLRSDAASEYHVTLIQFDANGSSFGPELTVSYIDKPLAEVSPLTKADYVPRGGTPLYDAIGECIRRVDAKGRAVTVVIVTDGEENSSKEFNLPAVQALIKSKEEEGWTFVFLGADIDAYRAGGALGMQAGNTIQYQKGMEQNLYSSMAEATISRSHGNMTVGVQATRCMAFFDDSQKMSAGDPTVSVGGYVHPTVTAPNVHVAPTPTYPVGGQPVVAPSFPVQAKADMGRNKRRNWKESVTR